MTKDEALKLALETLEAHADIGIKSDKAITAIREALAQPEQEPDIYPEEAYEMGLEAVAYYTTPQQHKPLEGVIDVQPIGYHSLQLIFKSQDDIAKFKAAHGIKD